jgi:hypothetical protein
MPYKDAAKQKAYQFDWRKRNNDKIREVAEKDRRKRVKDDPGYYTRAQRLWRARHPSRVAEQRREIADKARQTRRELIDYLGGKCSKCGFSNELALCFHHADGSGSEQRKSCGVQRGGGAGRKLRYMRLLFATAMTEPGRIELLCMNCHAIHHGEE